MNENEGIRTERVDNCLLCREPGQARYAGLRDRLFAAPGVWNFWSCPQCGLLWLNPRPIPDDIPKLYATYYTHEADSTLVRLPRFRKKLKHAILETHFGYEEFRNHSGWRWVGWLAGLIPPVRDKVGRSILYVRGPGSRRLLDVGCGGGGYLATMRELGWEVFGLEPDAEAAHLAEARSGVPIVVDTLEGTRLPEGSFDAVTLNHVIEHVADPMALLRAAGRVLKPEGRLVVVTPHLDSLGHRIFGHCWRELDPPRHFYLFSAATLKACALGSDLQIEELRTVARGAEHIWFASRSVRKTGRFNPGELTGRLKLEGLTFRVAEEVLRSFSHTAGEELVLVATRPK